MLVVTFVIKRTASGGYAAEWEDPQIEDGIRVEADTRAEVHDRAIDAFGNWMAYRGAIVETQVRFVEHAREDHAPEFGA